MCVCGCTCVCVYVPACMCGVYVCMRRRMRAGVCVRMCAGVIVCACACVQVPVRSTSHPFLLSLSLSTRKRQALSGKTTQEAVFLLMREEEYHSCPIQVGFLHGLTLTLTWWRGSPGPRQFDPPSHVDGHDLKGCHFTTRFIPLFFLFRCDPR